MEKRGIPALNTGIIATLIAMMLFAGCASTPKGVGNGSGSSAPKQTNNIERIYVDHKGAIIGADIPEWITAAVNDDLETIKTIPRFKGKVPFVDYGTGQNLDLLQSWINNFRAQAGVSRRISNTVQANFGGEQLGNKNTPENNNFVKEIVATFSDMEINGLAREMDYWTKLRTIDHGKGTETEQYYYYVVYSIAEEDLNYQIAQAMGKIAAKTQEQAEIKADVEAAMKRVAFNSIQSVE